jgi:DNA-binding response OmpR family regulator
MKKVLVLDDDLDILQLVQFMLSRAGLAVQTISRWQEIRQAIRQFEPGLILMDISLGTADGREICKSLKQDDDTKAIPIVLFSANVDFVNNIGECNAQGFLAKPFDMATLIDTVQSNLS